MRLALLLLVVVHAVHPAVAAKRPKPEPCAGGRFLVLEGGPLVAEAGSPRFDAVAIAAGQVGIDSGCAPARVKLKATKKGTVVRARWARCGSARAVKLQATIAAPACDTMTGVRKAKKQKAVRFRAVRSRCGDGAVDTAGGEACDQGAGCTAGQTCDDARCACVDPPATTTTSSTLAPATTTTSTSTSTTTTLPAGVCGNGTIDAGEPCDLFAAPSGCAGGQQCDLAAGQCACTAIPASIGKTVAFSLPPPPDPSTLPLPQTEDGTRYLNVGPGGMLTVPDAPADPLTAVARCTGWITACVSPPDRVLDDCARSAPHCTTGQPWLETERCCPAACFAAYEAQRQAGASAMLAFRTTYFTDASCFPGVAALLGND
ncbi:MAG: hypothetical protein KIT14_01185 [bacterium]|nr:hypothetical protein [bacterium]